MSNSIACFLLVILLGPPAWGSPLTIREPDSRPLGAGVVSELSQRLAAAAHGPAALDTRSQEPRLPSLPSLPSPQELEAIKKLAQILIMLGEQVIPTIIGDSSGSSTSSHSGHSVSPGCDHPPSAVEEIPNDPVNDK